MFLSPSKVKAHVYSMEAQIKKLTGAELVAYMIVTSVRLTSKKENSFSGRRIRKSGRVHWFLIIRVMSTETTPTESGIGPFAAPTAVTIHQ